MVILQVGQYITVDPRVCGGRLTFRNTRIKVADALEMLRAGMTPEQVAANYPELVSIEAVIEAAMLVGSGVIKELEEAA